MSERGPLFVAGLTRRRDGRWVAGVCSGLAAALGVQVGALRGVVVLLSLGSLPAVALLYALAWVFVPPEGEDGGAGSGEAGGGLVIGGRPADVVDAVGVLAVVCGAVLLLGQFTAWLPAEVVVPALLVAAGPLRSRSCARARSGSSAAWPAGWRPPRTSTRRSSGSPSSSAA